jgi:hypothetical protein
MAIEFQRTIPILRIFDEAKAREFYVGVIDPFGNRIRFNEEIKDDSSAGAIKNKSAREAAQGR